MEWLFAWACVVSFLSRATDSGGRQERWELKLGRGDMEEKRIPETLEEAYLLRDSAASVPERDFYQEHVYHLRAKKYRSRRIKIGRSVRRERSRAQALRAKTQEPQAEPEEAHRSWWKRIFGQTPRRASR